MGPFDVGGGTGVPGSGFAASELAWLMFMQSGQPGMYLFYNDLVNPPAEGDDLLE